MKAKLIAFGELEIDGKRYTHDVVIDRGRVQPIQQNGRVREGYIIEVNSDSGHETLTTGAAAPLYRIFAAACDASPIH